MKNLGLLTIILFAMSSITLGQKGVPLPTPVKGNATQTATPAMPFDECMTKANELFSEAQRPNQTASFEARRIAFKAFDNCFNSAKNNEQKAEVLISAAKVARFEDSITYNAINAENAYKYYRRVANYTDVSEAKLVEAWIGMAEVLVENLSNFGFDGKVGRDKENPKFTIIEGMNKVLAMPKISSESKIRALHARGSYFLNQAIYYKKAADITAFQNDFKAILAMKEATDSIKAKVWLQNANWASVTKDEKARLAAYEAILKLKKTTINQKYTAHYYSGRILLDEGNFTKARNSFASALKIPSLSATDIPRVRRYIAVSYLAEAGKTNNFEQLFQLAVKELDDMATSSDSKTQIYDDNARFLIAEKNLNKSLRERIIVVQLERSLSDKSSDEVNFKIGEYLYNQGNYEEARKYLSKVGGLWANSASELLRKIPAK